jgi:hypothetical protein
MAEMDPAGQEAEPYRRSYEERPVAPSPAAGVVADEPLAIRASA